MSWKLLLIVPVLVYVGIAAFLFFNQTSILFPAHHVAPAGPPPPGAEALQLRTPGGETLAGLHIQPVHEQPERVALVAFAGNAWNSAAAAEYLHGVFPDAHVVAFHYRGYAPSGGQPGARAMQEDALLVHDLVRERLRPGRLIVVGLSVGSGVAPFLAAHRPADGLILVTPFDSLANLSAGHYPWLPVRLLLRHRMEPADNLRDLRVPVAIIAGERDATVPPARTAALRTAVANLVYDRTIRGAGHNDIYDRPEFRAAMAEALNQVLASARED
jgi:uncharacterized protein